eukprot:TRINITY_DN979_c2_g1_i2.p1 TRINITY_DN979_c2_g1~~TRINITY_DN979_c2_g1_i2.p1  ORF type:complete len:146 (+),score=24.47 TRINITY_DN979_c2_g1_i2:31-468(+)
MDVHSPMDHKSNDWDISYLFGTDTTTYFYLVETDTGKQHEITCDNNLIQYFGLESSGKKHRVEKRFLPRMLPHVVDLKSKHLRQGSDGKIKYGGLQEIIRGAPPPKMLTPLVLDPITLKEAFTLDDGPTPKHKRHNLARRRKRRA